MRSALEGELGNVIIDRRVRKLARRVISKADQEKKLEDLLKIPVKTIDQFKKDQK